MKNAAGPLFMSPGGVTGERSVLKKLPSISERKTAPQGYGGHKATPVCHAAAFMR